MRNQVSKHDIQHLCDCGWLSQDQYMEVTSWIPEEASLYGAGEFTPSEGFRLRRDGAPIALWNQDQQAKAPDLNLYGARPFILSVLPGRRPVAPTSAAMAHADRYSLQIIQSTTSEAPLYPTTVVSCWTWPPFKIVIQYVALPALAQGVDQAVLAMPTALPNLRLS